MYKAFSSNHLGFPNRSVKDDIPLAVQFGFEGLGFDVRKEAAESSSSEIKDLLGAHKLKASGFGLPVNMRNGQEAYEADLKNLEKHCKFAQETGNTRSVCYISPFSDTLDYSANMKHHVTWLKPVAKTLEDHGIRIGFEFIGTPSLRRGKAHEFIHTMEGLFELIDAIGTSNLGCCMDLFHWDMAGHTYEDFKKIPNQEWIVVSHINDVSVGVSREDQPDMERELPGATGILKIADYMKGKRDLGYDGPVIVEPFNAAVRALPIEEAVKLAKASIDKVW